MMERSTTGIAEFDVLGSLVSHAIIAAHHGEDGTGTHLTLDDGRILVIIGFIGVLHPHAAVH